MELPSARAQSGDRPQKAHQPPRDGTQANAVNQARIAAPVDGHGRRRAVIGSTADQAAAMTVTDDPLALPTRPPSRPDLGRQRLAERLERVENPVTSRTELRERLNDLEPGHPSSPWEEDGTPRPPAPRLADLERLDPPLSDAAYAAHLTDVVTGLDNARATGGTTEKLYTVNPDSDIWTDSRAPLHDEMIEAAYARSANVPCERTAIMVGGLGGAGKTTLLDQYAGIDRSNYLTINPDFFKEELAKRGLVPEIPGLSPLESSTLAHEESSYLSRQLALKAIADGKNVLWDITMSSSSSTGRRIDELRTNGYQHIHGIFVDIPVETSVARMGERHRRGHDRFLAGQGLGGRYVPAEVIRSQADNEYGSINRRTFETLKDQFDSWTLYDNSIAGRPAILIQRSGPDHAAKRRLEDQR
ncbi:MAG TPA: zeta toxin family protein [Streptosporangiaceae bacterium]|nr:zeta toxin family protein [Streptosporangiaceae bacterium]